MDRRNFLKQVGTVSAAGLAMADLANSWRITKAVITGNSAANNTCIPGSTFAIRRSEICSLPKQPSREINDAAI